MAVTIESVFYLVLVALLWGGTNPLIKKGSIGLDSVKASTPWGQFAKEVLFLVTNLKYIIPFLVNQGGSVLYFLTLQNTDLSLAVPVSNSLTFVFTAVAGWILGEEKSHISKQAEPAAISNARNSSLPEKRPETRPDKIFQDTYIGMMMILAGTTLCCIDKLEAS